MRKRNKSQMFRTVIAVAVGLVLLPTACKKSFLDVPPQGQQASQQFWQTKEDAAKAVAAIYANLRVWEQVAFAPIAVESMGSDETEKGSSPSDASFMNNFDNFTHTSTEGQVNDFWLGQYRSINLANQVLTNVPNISMDATLQARYLAEAKFVRAYNYFRLVRAFGGVPLRLSNPTDATQYNLPRATKEEVYAAIEKDLTEAAAVLPQSYGPADVGRATKGAALALHAKVAMYQKKWADVLAKTNQVMTMGYSLFPNLNSSSAFPMKIILNPSLRSRHKDYPAFQVHPTASIHRYRVYALFSGADGDLMFPHRRWWIHLK